MYQHYILVEPTHRTFHKTNPCWYCDNNYIIMCVVIKSMSFQFNTWTELFLWVFTCTTNKAEETLFTFLMEDHHSHLHTYLFQKASCQCLYTECSKYTHDLVLAILFPEISATETYKYPKEHARRYSMVLSLTANNSNVHQQQHLDTEQILNWHAASPGNIHEWWPLT